MAILNNTRNQILASPLMDPAAAGILDTQTAGAAIARHNEQLKYLRNSVALLVMRINSYCFPLEQCLAGALIRGETGTAVSSATGDLSMPTEQLMGTSEALSEYAVELETQHCGSELLEEVEVTHGWFSARDSLPALSRFVKLHDSLLALVGQEIRLQAKNLGDAALRYLRTDAVSAELVSSAAANSPI